MTLDEHLRDEHEEAYQEGYDTGVGKGIDMGINMGIGKGIDIGTDNDIRKLLKRMTIEQVAEALEVPAERVQKIANAVEGD